MTELDELFKDFHSTRSRATRAEVSSMERELNLTVPSDLAEFLMTRGAGEGFLGETYLRIWTPQE